jgi:hypothetical protein
MPDRPQTRIRQVMAMRIDEQLGRAPLGRSPLTSEPHSMREITPTCRLERRFEDRERHLTVEKNLDFNTLSEPLHSNILEKLTMVAQAIALERVAPGSGARSCREKRTLSYQIAYVRVRAARCRSCPSADAWFSVFRPCRRTLH